MQILPYPATQVQVYTDLRVNIIIWGRFEEGALTTLLWALQEYKPFLEISRRMDSHLWPPLLSAPIYIQMPKTSSFNKRPADCRCLDAGAARLLAPDGQTCPGRGKLRECGPTTVGTHTRGMTLMRGDWHVYKSYMVYVGKTTCLYFP